MHSMHTNNTGINHNGLYAATFCETKIIKKYEIKCDKIAFFYIVFMLKSS